MLRTNLTNENILFLDFDGVLNDITLEQTLFADEPLQVLNELYEEYNCKIILNTTWKDAYLFTDLVDLLKSQGLNAPILDKITKGNTRTEQLQQFIKQYNCKHYVILDDCLITDCPELAKHQLQGLTYYRKQGYLKHKHKEDIKILLNLERNPLWPNKS